MKCEKCGAVMKKGTGSVFFKSKVLGSVSIPGLKVEACSGCDAQLLVPSESDKMIQLVLKAESERISHEKFSDFVSLNEAAHILGQSKQAFNKNKKIQAGFIMSAVKDSRRFYLRASVEMFLEQGDGRFYLGRNAPSIGGTKVSANLYLGSQTSGVIS